jgi:nuclear transport factor 2 (NTF2) superfamily protein
VALAYTEDTEWRNRAEFIKGRDAVREVRRGGGTAEWGNEGAAGQRQHGQGDRSGRCCQFLCNYTSTPPLRTALPPAVPPPPPQFLCRKWEREQEYVLRKYLWAHNGGNRISVCFEYEYRDPQGQWFRAYGNENWEFDQQVWAARGEGCGAGCCIGGLFFGRVAGGWAVPRLWVRVLFCLHSKPLSSPCCARCAAGPDAQACGQHQRGTHNGGAAPHRCPQSSVQHMAGRPGGGMQCSWCRVGVGSQRLSALAARLAVVQVSRSGRPAATCRASAATSLPPTVARRPTDARHSGGCCLFHQTGLHGLLLHTPSC